MVQVSISSFDKHSWIEHTPHVTPAVGQHPLLSLPPTPHRACRQKSMARTQKPAARRRCLPPSCAAPVVPTHPQSRPLPSAEGREGEGRQGNGEGSQGYPLPDVDSITHVHLPQAHAHWYQPLLFNLRYAHLRTALASFPFMTPFPWHFNSLKDYRAINVNYALLTPTK